MLPGRTCPKLALLPFSLCPAHWDQNDLYWNASRTHGIGQVLTHSQLPIPAMTLDNYFPVFGSQLIHHIGLGDHFPPTVSPRPGAFGRNLPEHSVGLIQRCSGVHNSSILVLKVSPQPWDARGKRRTRAIMSLAPMSSFMEVKPPSEDPTVEKSQT